LSKNHQSPKPELSPVNIKDGEQYGYWELHDVFESFDADEFEAAIILYIKP
jgi:hypothetical protein